jgi:Rod binding domain-containing protein
MSLLESKAIALPRGDSTGRALKPTAASQKETARAKLQKATREFESLFSFYMLKSMRQSVSIGKDKQEGFMSSGLGKDTFTEMFDMKMAEKIATKGKQSISTLMYNQMVKQIDQKDADIPLKTSLESARNMQAPVFKLHERGDAQPPQEQIMTETPLQVSHARTESKPIPQFVVNQEPYPFEFDLTTISQEEANITPQSEEIKSSPDTTASPQPQISSAHRQIFALYGEQIEKAAKQTSLDSGLIASVIHAESSGNAEAVSSAGAKGLMQLMDSTAVQYDVTKPFDPQENITAGSRYLRDLIDRFGDVKLALAAYNAGPSNVRKFNGVPPFTETINYVSKVLSGYTSADETVKLSAIKENSPTDR